jgi:hypothetical protein
MIANRAELVALSIAPMPSRPAAARRSWPTSDRHLPKATLPCRICRFSCGSGTTCMALCGRAGRRNASARMPAATGAGRPGNQYAVAAGNPVA